MSPRLFPGTLTVLTVCIDVRQTGVRRFYKSMLVLANNVGTYTDLLSSFSRHEDNIFTSTIYVHAIVVLCRCFPTPSTRPCTPPGFTTTYRRPQNARKPPSSFQNPSTSFSLIHYALSTPPCRPETLQPRRRCIVFRESPSHRLRDESYSSFPLVQQCPAPLLAPRCRIVVCKTVACRPPASGTLPPCMDPPGFNMIFGCLLNAVCTRGSRIDVGWHWSPSRTFKRQG